MVGWAAERGIIIPLGFPRERSYGDWDRWGGWVGVKGGYNVSTQGVESRGGVEVVGDA